MEGDRPEMILSSAATETVKQQSPHQTKPSSDLIDSTPPHQQLQPQAAIASAKPSDAVVASGQAEVSPITIANATHQSVSGDGVQPALKVKKRKKKKRLPHKSKMVTGYIIYASEIRKDIIKKYPDREFGDISKIVGVEWKNLPQETKTAFEKRAQEQNARSKLAAAEAMELKKLADAAEERAAKEQQQQQTQLPNNKNYSYSKLNQQTKRSNSISHLSQQQTVVQNSSPMPTSPYQEIPAQQQQAQTDTAMRTFTQQQPNQTQIHLPNQRPLTTTTVQYCRDTSFSPQQQPIVYYSSQNSTTMQQTPTQLNNNQYQRNTIIYKKPATVRLKPRDDSTQTDPIVWVDRSPLLEPKKPLRFSQKFIDHLNIKYNPSVQPKREYLDVNNGDRKMVFGEDDEIDLDQHDQRKPPQQPLIPTNGTNLQLSSPETNDSAYSSTIVWLVADIAVEA